MRAKPVTITWEEDLVKKMTLALLLGAMFAVGCGDKKEGGGDKKDEKSGGGDSVGVAECDEYLKAAEGCTSKMPEAGRQAWSDGLKTSREAWKQAASTPAGKDSLKTACKAAADAMKSNPACK